MHDVEVEAPKRTRWPFAVVLVLGILVGLIGGAAVGYGLGLLMLAWFAGPYCCGLEGLLAPGIGTMMGAAAGLLVALALIIDNRSGRRMPRAVTLVVVWALCLGLAWAVGKIISFDYEDLLPVVAFHTIALVAPLAIWWTWGRDERADAMPPDAAGERV